MRHHLRNPVATAPILRKGGAHRKSRSADRAEARARLKRETVEWPPPETRDALQRADASADHQRSSTQAGISIPSPSSL